MSNYQSRKQQGWWMAQRRMQEMLGNRMDIVEKKIYEADMNGEAVSGLHVELDTLQYVRNFIRNNMLWDNAAEEKEAKEVFEKITKK